MGGEASTPLLNLPCSPVELHLVVPFPSLWLGFWRTSQFNLAWEPLTRMSSAGTSGLLHVKFLSSFARNLWQMNPRAFLSLVWNMRVDFQN